MVSGVSIENAAYFENNEENKQANDISVFDDNLESASEDNKNDLSEPPQLFSDEDNLNTSSENNQDEVFKNEDEEEFEIPAFLRKQKF